MCLIVEIFVLCNQNLIKQHDVKPHVKCSIKSQLPSQKAVRVGVLGASGYTGSEVTYIQYAHT